MSDEEKFQIYSVTLPIAGHAYVVVEARSEEEAIQQAMEEVTIDNIEYWEAVEQFNQGNVCYCPHPWEAEAREDTPDDYEPSAEALARLAPPPTEI